MKQVNLSITQTPKKQAHSWAKGFIIKGRRVFHPYTLIDFDPNKNKY